MSEPYIVIDENRDINVPEELRGRIVQFDHNVETFTFQCPRYWDGRDLSAMEIFVNYVIDPKKGTCSAYLVKELNVNEADDNMTFDWVVTQDATTKDGELIIFVCAQLTDELGNLQHHWSSNFNKDFKLAKSYKCLQGIVDNYPNIIGQMLADIDKLKENGGSVTFTYNEATGDVTFGNETVLAAPEGIEAHTEIVSINGRGLQDAVARKKISELSEEIANLQISGLTTAQVNALDGMFKKCAYTEDATAEYEAFKTAFGISGGGTVEPDEPSEPDAPEVTLSSITATYSGGDVTVGTALTDLNGITVTATYSDGSTTNVTDYTLSGEIAEGSNTITVSYGGKTTTFVVIGVTESGSEPTLREITHDLSVPSSLNWSPTTFNLSEEFVEGKTYKVVIDGVSNANNGITFMLNSNAPFMTFPTNQNGVEEMTKTAGVFDVGNTGRVKCADGGTINSIKIYEMSE